MKTVCKKLLCLMLVAMLLVSAVPAAFAAEVTSCPDGHTGKQWTLKAEEHVDATCTAPGKDVYYCGGDAEDETVSGHNKTVEIPALGHNYVEGVCSRCDAEDPNYVPPCQHNDTVKGTTATCTAGGTEIERCSDCGFVVDRKSVEALGHDMKNGVCTRCGEAEKVEEEKAETVDITIYEVEVDYDGDVLNAVEYKTVNDVDVDSYASMDAMVRAIYGKQFSDYKYRDHGDGTATLNVYHVATEGNKAVYQLKVMYNNGTSNYKLFDIYEGEGILAAIKNSGFAPKYEDHVLVGYLKNHTGNSKTYLTIYDVASAANANANGVITVYADWRESTDDDDEDFEYGEGGGLYGDDNDDPIYDVVLYIYTNGKTSSPAKTVKSSAMGRFTKDGVLTDDEVQMVVENYFKTNSDTKYYGLFTKYYWNGGDYLTANAKYEIKLDADETNYVYVMVKNATPYVADSSNPKTGDNIMIAVTTMTLAAAALVAMVELKKRKMI